VRQLAAIAPLTAIFGLSLAVGVAAYLWLGRAPEERSAPTRIATTTTPQPPHRPATAAAASPFASRPSTLPQASGGSRPGAASDATSGHRSRSRNRLSHKEARQLVKRVFAGKLPDRELQDDEYDRLAGAVLRLRSALRQMRRANERGADDAATARYRAIVASAFAEIERITGVPPQGLGEVLTSDGDRTPDDAQR
jgi:hypothetical protein